MIRADELCGKKRPALPDTLHRTIRNCTRIIDGTGAFTQSGTFAIGPVDDPRAVAFADIDQDGDLDFFYAQKRTFNRAHLLARYIFPALNLDHCIGCRYYLVCTFSWCKPTGPQ